MVKPIAIEPGPNNRNSLHVCWMLHNACNNRCSYCNPNYYGGDQRWLKLQNLKDFWSGLRDHYQREHIHVSFTGGEPTLWPEFSQLVHFLKDEGCDLGMTSNGGHKMTLWEEMKDSWNWLCLSFHPEFTKEEHFLKVIETMASRTRLAVRLMMHKEEKFWIRSVDFGERIKKLSLHGPVFVEYVPLQDSFGGYQGEVRPMQYQQWQLEFIQKNNYFTHGECSEEVNLRLQAKRDVWDYQVKFADGTQGICRPNEMVANNQVNFQNWTCFAGMDMLFINSWGEIFRGGCKVGGLIGHLFDPVIQFPKQPVLCPKTFCGCGTDIQVKKYS